MTPARLCKRVAEGSPFAWMLFRGILAGEQIAKQANILQRSSLAQLYSSKHSLSPLRMA